MLKGCFITLCKTLLKITCIAIVLLAVLLNSARFIINFIPAKHEFLAAIATEYFKQPVKVGSVVLKGTASHPIFVLKSIAINSPKNKKKNQLFIKNASIALNLWKSVWQRQLITDYLIVNHLNAAYQPKQSIAKAENNNLLIWFFAQPEVLFQNMHLSSSLPIPGHLSQYYLNLLIKNKNNSHEAAGYIHLLKSKKKPFSFALNVYGNNFFDKAMKGTAYLSLQKFQLNELREILPDKWKSKLPSKLKGDTTGRLWAHLKNRHWQLIRFDGQLSHLSGFFRGKKWALTPLNLHGRYNIADGRNGRIVFDAQHMKVQSDALFSKPLKNISMHGELALKNSDGLWRLNIPQFILSDAHLNFNSHFSLSFTKNSPPYLDLLGHFSFNDLRLVPQYLPAQVLKPGLFQWLESALKKGRVPSGQLLFQGKLSDFPYLNHDGRFEATAQLADTQLHYYNRWPNITDLDGRLIFDNQGMYVKSSHAVIAKNNVQSIKAKILNLAHPDLQISANMQTPLSRGLHLLEQSPLSFAHDLNAMQGDGNVNAHLKLDIPLYKGHGKAHAQGRVDLNKNLLQLNAWHFTLSHLYGQLHFINNSIVANNLSAQLFHQLVSISLSSDAKKKALLIHASSNVDMSHVKKQFNSPLLKSVSGNTNVQAQLTLHSANSPYKNNLLVTTNLKGLSALGMPQPFQKAREDIWPSQLNFTFLPTGDINVKAHLFKKIDAHLAFSKNNNGFKFRSGAISLGGDNARLRKKPGLYIDGFLPTFAVDAWKKWLESQKSVSINQQAHQNILHLVKHIDLTIKRLQLAQQIWHDVDVSLSNNKKVISLQLQNDSISGDIHFPVKKGQPIQAYFQYLFLNTPKTQNNSAINPAKLPAMTVKIDDFRLNGNSFGSVNFALKPIKRGVLVSHIGANSPLFLLNAKGRWLENNGFDQTWLNGNFASDDLGQFLLNRHLSSRLKGGVLSTKFRLYWPASPSHFQIDQAKGQVSMQLKEGRILHLNTETESNLSFGRLLNILSLESISHYLTFNFSMLTHEGFPFHTVSGDFAIDSGELESKNVDVDGPLAHAHLVGKIGIKDQPSDFELSVVPYISSSLPVIIGLAGGPIAGITAWLANKLIAPKVGHLIQMRYHVTGTWQHPVVKKLPS